jgi:hypothetical protein
MKQIVEQISITCPACGAPPVNGLTCWEQLGALLAWEWQDPALLAVHFLTVASYNLQHPAQFTDEALAALRTNFIAHLDQDVPVTEVRRRTSRFAEGATRVLKKAVERQPGFRNWSMTIADVYLPDQLQGAAERVRAWAAAIRREL